MARILLVDDEPELVELTKTVLVKDGYEVSIARNAKECFKELGKKRPDLILLDIMMPGENGWKVCKKIKSDEKIKDIPVVMFTVRTSEDSKLKSMKYARADDQLNKPFSLKKLRSIIKEYI